MKQKVIDLNKLVKGMLEMLDRLLGENIDLVWKSEEELSLIRVDSSQENQIVMNLVVNARNAVSGSGMITLEKKMSPLARPTVRKIPM